MAVQARARGGWLGVVLCGGGGVVLSAGGGGGGRASTRVCRRRRRDANVTRTGPPLSSSAEAPARDEERPTSARERPDKTRNRHVKQRYEASPPSRCCSVWVIRVMVVVCVSCGRQSAVETPPTDDRPSRSIAPPRAMRRTHDTAPTRTLSERRPSYDYIYASIPRSSLACRSPRSPAGRRRR